MSPTKIGNVPMIEQRTPAEVVDNNRAYATMRLEVGRQNISKHVRAVVPATVVMLLLLLVLPSCLLFFDVGAVVVFIVCSFFVLFILIVVWFVC